MALLVSPYCLSHNIQMWQRKVNCNGVGTWVLLKTTEMHDIHGLPPPARRGMELIRGYAEDADEIFLYLDGTVYMVQLKSMQSKRIYGTDGDFNFYPFMSFYPPSECSSLFISYRSNNNPI